MNQIHFADVFWIKTILHSLPKILKPTQPFPSSFGDLAHYDGYDDRNFADDRNWPLIRLLFPLFTFGIVSAIKSYTSNVGDQVTDALLVSGEIH